MLNKNKTNYKKITFVNIIIIFNYTAHLATVHSKGMSKAASKQARTLDIEFTLAPRMTRDGTGRNNRRRVDEAIDSEPGGSGFPAPSIPLSSTLINSDSTFYNPLKPEDFPSLNGQQTTPVHIPSVTFTSKINPNRFNQENFPSLGPSSRSGSVTITGKMNTFNNEDFPSLKTNGNVRAPEVTITRTVRGSQGLKKNNENFPALGESSGSSTVRLSVK